MSCTLQVLVKILKAINEDKCPGIKDGGWLLFMNYKVKEDTLGGLCVGLLIARLRAGSGSYSLSSTS